MKPRHIIHTAFERIYYILGAVPNSSDAADVQLRVLKDEDVPRLVQACTAFNRNLSGTDLTHLDQALLVAWNTYSIDLITESGASIPGHLHPSPDNWQECVFHSFKLLAYFAETLNLTKKECETRLINAGYLYLGEGKQGLRPTEKAKDLVYHKCLETYPNAHVTLKWRWKVREILLEGYSKNSV